jgi:dTDP-4-dehydrorhamnose 3,5-epimerase
VFTPGEIEGVLFKPLKQHADARGWLIEMFRNDELPPEDQPRMGYVSETLPGVARGPHEHVEQADYFLFLGPGDFKLYLWDARQASSTFHRRQTVIVGQSNRQAVLIPPGVVHAYKNVSDAPGWVINCPNRLYAGEGRKQAVDEIRHEDDPDSAYALD